MHNINSSISTFRKFHRTKNKRFKRKTRSRNLINKCKTMTNSIELNGDSNSTFTKELDNDKGSHFIKCIFFCKFHATAGPQIVTQVPNNYISKDVFDTISQYMIPKAQLQRCFVSV